MRSPFTVELAAPPPDRSTQKILFSPNIDLQNTAKRARVLVLGPAGPITLHNVRHSGSQATQKHRELLTTSTQRATHGSKSHSQFLQRQLLRLPFLRYPTPPTTTKAGFGPCIFFVFFLYSLLCIFFVFCICQPCLSPLLTIRLCDSSSLTDTSVRMRRSQVRPACE